MARTPQKQLLDSLRSSLASSAYSDFKITCGSDTYKVHKVIVCNRAGFFARAVSFGGRETKSGILDLPEDEPETVKLLIQYLYEGEYEPQLPPAAESLSTTAIYTPVKRGKSSSKKPDYHLVFPHTCSYDKMYEMAEKYEVISLKELAKEKFNRGYNRFWNTLDFHIAASHAFSTTPEDDTGLRDLVSQTITKHMELTQAPDIRKLLMQFNGLALGILDAKGKEVGWNLKSEGQPSRS
ncbi:hypothetical protein J3E72DRAFT_395355 [Bipolaris maydis]|nr:hypothetical protein J3E72DRAFT_395355 [Bipolaris maydis]